MPLLRNLTEEAVWDQLEQLIARGQVACECSACRADIMSYVLNRVTPIYISSLAGSAIGKSKSGSSQFLVDVLRFLHEAVQIVNEKPSHAKGAPIDLKSMLHEYIFICSTDFVITYVTRESAVFLGYSQDYLTNRPVSELFDKQSGQVQERLSEAINTGKPQEIKKIITRKTGGRYELLFAAAPICGEKGIDGLLFRLKRIVDLTEHPAVQQETVSLGETTLPQEEMTQDLSEILAGIDQMERLRSRGGIAQSGGVSKTLGQNLVEKARNL